MDDATIASLKAGDVIESPTTWPSPGRFVVREMFSGWVAFQAPDGDSGIGVAPSALKDCTLISRAADAPSTIQELYDTPRESEPARGRELPMSDSDEGGEW